MIFPTIGVNFLMERNSVIESITDINYQIGAMRVVKKL